MCTAIVYKSGSVYFGRNLDLERGYKESVVITPRAFHVGTFATRYAMVGMATVSSGVPLYYEATNEKSVSAAGLHFPGNAVYYAPIAGKDNIPPYAFIPWVLGQCADIGEVKLLLQRTNLVNVAFSRELPVSPLHWLISDRKTSITVECGEEGMRVWDNPFNVLTNNPPFSYHQTNLSNYMGLGTGQLQNRFDGRFPLRNYSLGMGALGLPGDFSSASRFVRVFFVKENAIFGSTEEENVRQFFHILQSVAMPKGCVWTENGYEYTRYSSCCNVENGVYYYITYNDFTIRSVSMRDVDLDGETLYIYPVTGM